MLASPLQRPARIVNMSRLGHALTELESPPVKALFVYNSNPAAIAPNQNAVVRGLMRDDLFTVVSEQFFTDTTDYADLVLPATTFLEHKDFQERMATTFCSCQSRPLRHWARRVRTSGYSANWPSA